MTPETLLDRARRAGLVFVVTADGAVKVRGSSAVIDAWVPILKPHRDAIRRAMAASDPETRQRKPYRFRTADGGGTYLTDGDARAELKAFYMDRLVDVWELLIH